MQDNVKVILDKSYKIENQTLINTKDIKESELKILEQNGYKVKLFNYTWLQNPYYSINK